jgi:hypothetical protein
LRVEHLTSRCLLNRILLLCQNLHNVGKWIKRSRIWTK